MRVEHWWILLTGRIEVHGGKKPVPVPLCAPHIPHVLSCGWSQPLHWEAGD